MKPMLTLIAAICSLTPLAMAQVPTLGGGGAKAGPTSGEQVTHVTLLTDRTAIAPGQSIQVGLLFEMDEHWHIYWRNPGEAGMPPRVKWQLPDGFVMSELRWPTPVQFDQGGGIIGYGYMHKAMFTATLTAPSADKFPPGQAVRIQAAVDWLVCKDMCLPGTQSLSIGLALHEGKPQNTDLFDHWQKQLPQPAAVKVTGVRGTAGEEATVSLQWPNPVEQVAFFPLPGNDLEIDVGQVTPASPGTAPGTNPGTTADVTLTVHPLDKIQTPGIKVTGLVVWQADGRRQSSEVEFTLPVAKNDASVTDKP